MVRISKQAEKRHQSPRKRQKRIIKKTGSLRDNLPLGYKEHLNALQGEIASKAFIAKIK